ncbi:MAG TPA: hypothetical protein VJ770_13720 [Stellaceae bacterium]|nr:hypothetical protein [Stellaceae bacterium]
MSRTLSLCLAAALLAPAGAVLAQPLPRNNPAAEQNVIQSERYSQVLRTSPTFRDRRIQEECGPITDPRLHAECVASFPPTEAPMRHPVRHRHH